MKRLAIVKSSKLYLPTNLFMILSRLYLYRQSARAEHARMTTQVTGARMSYEYDDATI